MLNANILYLLLVHWANFFIRLLGALAFVEPLKSAHQVPAVIINVVFKYFGLFQ